MVATSNRRNEARAFVLRDRRLVDFFLVDARFLAALDSFVDFAFRLFLGFAFAMIEPLCRSGFAKFV